MAATTFESMPGNLDADPKPAGCRQTSLDPDWPAPSIGHGGPLNILYVTGDYYDVNAVWQTNITSDVDVMYQLQNQPSADCWRFIPTET